MIDDDASARPSSTSALRRQLDDLQRRAQEKRQRRHATPQLWALEKRASLALLNDDDVTLADDAHRRPVCDSCTDQCCAKPEGLVSVRLDDAVRLVDAGHAAKLIAPRELVARVPELAVALGDLVARDSFREFFTIERNVDGGCAFLVDKRCSVYDIRPMQCRAFPHQVDDTKTTVRYASSCQSSVPMAADDVGAATSRAVRSYNAKVEDLVVLTLSHTPLESAGLIPMRSTVDDNAG